MVALLFKGLLGILWLIKVPNQVPKSFVENYAPAKLVTTIVNVLFSKPIQIICQIEKSEKMYSNCCTFQTFVLISARNKL